MKTRTDAISVLRAKVRELRATLKRIETRIYVIERRQK